MSMTGIGEVADLAKTVVGKIWPDHSAEDQAKIQGAIELALGQIKVNQTAAGSKFWFVAAARPALLWAGVLAFLFQYVIVPIGAMTGHQAPAFDATPLVTILMTLIGARSYEKKNGVAGDH